jgi:signal transduction histidine kinase
MRALRLHNALAEDRARIARDMHDDLGTRISVLTMSGALVRRHFESDPATSLAHLDRMDAASRSLVAAMDDLVWSVDPGNDTLEEFGNFLARCAQEIFGQSPIQCRLDLPADLPEVTLHSEMRHHLSLTVKECCHNILRHAGPCEAGIKLRHLSESGRLTVEISDTGRGFDPSAPRDGNGLDNMRRRIEEIEGTIEFTSVVSEGTKVRLQVEV